MVLSHFFFGLLGFCLGYRGLCLGPRAVFGFHFGSFGFRLGLHPQPHSPPPGRSRDGARDGARLLGEGDGRERRAGVRRRGRAIIAELSVGVLAKALMNFDEAVVK